jgi:2-polyprenyl-3-methyl-5-hydroxy-6-metoxy-1,4-benzoquinol methylase
MSSASPFHDPARTWNQRYAGDGYHFGIEPNDWLRTHAGVWQPGQRVLCVGDGEGRNSVWLAQRGLVVDAFDIAETGVAKARRLAAESGVTVNAVVSDCDGYAWQPEAWDGIAAIFVQFADPAMRARLFTHMIAGLKPGGTLVLQGYTPRQLDYRTGGPPLLEHLYTEAMLRAAFAALEIVELRDYEAEVAEGAGHRGWSALIGLVGRKR